MLTRYLESILDLIAASKSAPDGALSWIKPLIVVARSVRQLPGYVTSG